MSTLEIVELCLICGAVIGMIVYCIVVGIKNKWFGKLWEALKAAIKEAEEKFPDSGSGEKKKAYVIGKMEEKCKELGIPYSLLKKLINKAIEKVVEDYNIIKK